MVSSFVDWYQYHASVTHLAHFVIIPDEVSQLFLLVIQRCIQFFHLVQQVILLCF